ncbi:MAG: hypothetical protein JW709_04070 [Sedimentisphaerales bacterium]|nr:hypothetical protein [Sedimentisphaerales bacterium]
MSKIRYHKAFLALSAGLLVLTAGLCVWAAPKPSLVPEPGLWQLDIQLHGQPQQINVVLPGDTEPTRFWYLLYTITNNTGEDVNFYPRADLFTDTLLTYTGGAKSRRQVFEAIRQRHATAIPLLEMESQVTGPILQGEDNARDTVAIFEEFDPQATKVQIFISGLSNETVQVKNPMGAQGKESDTVLLRKTLALDYQVPGDEYNPANRVLLYRGRNWIMR